MAAFEAALSQQQVRQLHLLNLESLSKAQQQDFFKGFNYHREHIARNCGGFLLFWLPEHLVAKLAVEAADFWAWREQVFDFSLPLEPVERFLFDDLVKNRNADASIKQKRIKEIEDFLAYSTEELSLTAADLKRELGDLYTSIGEYTKAKKMIETAIHEYGQLDEAYTRGAVRSDLANLLADQGELDQALNILQEQVLPVVKQLGDIYAKTVTMGKIADILYERGELDEALRIRQQEVLPIFEQLGDVRSKAVTMGKIADILYERDELDEALRIRQKEELPVYERLGEVREKAVTMGKIADIFKQRGELDEALRIQEQEVLSIFERLGDVRGLLICQTQIARLLQDIDAKANKDKIDELLRLALADAKRLKLPKDIERIEGIMKELVA